MQSHHRIEVLSHQGLSRQGLGLSQQGLSHHGLSVPAGSVSRGAHARQGHSAVSGAHRAALFERKTTFTVLKKVTSQRLKASRALLALDKQEHLPSAPAPWRKIRHNKPKLMPANATLLIVLAAPTHTHLTRFCVSAVQRFDGSTVQRFGGSASTEIDSESDVDGVGNLQ